MFFTFLIVGGLIGYLVFNNRENKLNQKNENGSGWKYERYPVFETLLSSEAYFEPIYIQLIYRGSNEVKVKAGPSGLMEDYIVPVDKDYIKVEDEFQSEKIIKTNDTYVKINSSSFYLYAYQDESNAIHLGLAH